VARDAPPATEESLPGHGPSRARRPLRRQAVPAKGRAADEAAARRKQRACPCAEAKAAGFESAQPGFECPRAGELRIRRGGTSVRLMPAAAGLRPARCHRRGQGFGPEFVGQDRASARELRNRRTQDFGPWPPWQIPASAGDPAGRGPTVSAGGAPGWDAGRKLHTAERRTARASALVGEPAGKPAAAPAASGPRRKRRFRTPGSARAAHSKPPGAERLASQARFKQRDSGGRRRRRPSLLWEDGRPSRTCPGSRQRS
jgi:hypothetical protein